MENDSGIRTRRLGEHLWLVSLHGEHDMAGRDSLHRAFSEVFAAGSKLVIDLTEATFIDSSVVSALLDAHEHALGHAAHDLAVIAAPGSPPRRVLDLTGVSSALSIYDDRLTAVFETDAPLVDQATRRHQRRLAHNEVLFRRANDRIEDHARSRDIDDERVAFFCECADRDCGERIYATIAEYERAHESATRFLLLPGHEQPRIEHVTDRSERYVVVEKDGPVGEFAATELS